MLTVRTFNSPLSRMLSMNRVLDEVMENSWNGTNGHVWVPALDVLEREDAYLITLDVPGVDPSTIDVSFEQNVLTVRGERAIATPDNGGKTRVHASERVTGAFQRAVHLPEFVDAEHISAESKHGVVSLTVPKAQAARARKIAIASR